MSKFKDLLIELSTLSNHEQLLDQVDPANEQFVKNSFKQHKFKIYEISQSLPYEISDDYLGCGYRYH